MATVAASIVAASIARREGFSLFGAFVLAALAATGGGVIRDMLIDRSPPVVIAQPAYLFTVGATILLYFAMDKLSALLNRNRRLRLMQWSLRSRLSRPGEWILVICDGMSLGIFTYVGVIAALRANCTPLLMWGPLLAAMTTSGGAILRDVVRGMRENELMKSLLYAEISLLGGLAMSAGLVSGHLGELELSALMILSASACCLAHIIARGLKIAAPAFHNSRSAANSNQVVGRAAVANPFALYSVSPPRIQIPHLAHS